jgi:single-stranded DNA-binding protein
MNACFISGRLIGRAEVRGSKTKVLVFVVETVQGGNGFDAKETVREVPCVMFNPAPEIESLLTSHGRGLTVAFQGRVNGSRLDGKDGKPRYHTEVVVFNKSFVVARQ